MAILLELESIRMYIILVVFCMKLTVGLAQHQEAIAGLIKAFHNGCVYIAYGDEVSASVAWKVARALSEEGVAVCALKISQLKEQRYFCEHQRPFYVLLNTSNINQVIDEEWAFKVQWLVVIPVNAHRDVEADILYGILLQINCLFFVARTNQKGGFDLYEVYRLARGRPLLRRLYGRWAPETGLRFASKLGFYERRANLQGITIKAVTLEDWSNTELEVVNNKTILKSGFYGKVWQILEEKLNFKTEFSVVSNLTWLSQKNQTVLTKEDTQAAVISISMQSSRLSVVDFTFPLYGNKYYLFIREPAQRQLIWTSVFQPFHKTLWIGIAGCALTFIICIILVSYFFNRPYPFFEPISNPDAITYVLGAFCNQGYDPTSSLLAIRFFFFLACFFGVIIVAAYSADNISELTQAKVLIPFKGLKGLAKDGTYELGTLDISKGLLPDYYIKNSSWQKVYQKVLYPHFKENVPKTEPQALARVCSKRYAYFSHVYKILPFIRTLRPCRLLKLPGPVAIKLGIAFAKGSPYLRLIDYYIKIFRMVGILRKLRVTVLSTSLNDDQKEIAPVELVSSAPILIILASGMVLAFICMIFEFWRNQ